MLEKLNTNSIYWRAEIRHNAPGLQTADVNNTKAFGAVIGILLDVKIKKNIAEFTLVLHIDMHFC